MISTSTFRENRWPLAKGESIFWDSFGMLALYDVTHYLALVGVVREFSFNKVRSKDIYKISREKLEPEPGFEPRTSGFLARRSATRAILVLMPAHVQIFLLRRIPLLPGGAVMTLSAIILTTIELTLPFT